MLGPHHHSDNSRESLQMLMLRAAIPEIRPAMTGKVQLSASCFHISRLFFTIVSPHSVRSLGLFFTATNNRWISFPTFSRLYLSTRSRNSSILRHNGSEDRNKFWYISPLEIFIFPFLTWVGSNTLATISSSCRNNYHSKH